MTVYSMTTFTWFSSSSPPLSSPSPPSPPTNIFFQSEPFFLLNAVVDGYWCFWSHSITQKHTLIWPPRRRIGLSQRSVLYMLNAQHSQERDIHVPGGIQTRSLSADLRLTPRGRCYLPHTNMPFQILAALLSCLTVRILYLAWLLRALWWQW